MILVDGGTIPWTFASDFSSESSWSDFSDYHPRLFNGILDIEDFEVVAAGEDPVESTRSCENGVDRSARVQALLK